MQILDFFIIITEWSQFWIILIPYRELKRLVYWDWFGLKTIKYDEYSHIWHLQPGIWHLYVPDFDTDGEIHKAN